MQSFIDRIWLGTGYILSPVYSSVSHATHSPRRLAEETSERSIRCLTLTFTFAFYLLHFTFPIFLPKNPQKYRVYDENDRKRKILYGDRGKGQMGELADGIDLKIQEHGGYFSWENGKDRRNESGKSSHKTRDHSQRHQWNNQNICGQGNER